MQITSKETDRKIQNFLEICNIYISQQYTVFPASSDPFYIVSYYIKWFTTSHGHTVERLL